MSSENKKICMLVRNNFLHDTRVLKEARTLSQSGYNITLVAIKKFKELSEHEEIMPNVTLYRIPVDKNLPSMKKSEGNTAKQGSASFARKVVKKLYSFVRPAVKKIKRTGKFTKIDTKIILKGYREKADVYHVHDLNMLFEGYVCARLNKSKLIYDSHELFTERNTQKKSRFMNFILSNMEKRLIRRCDGVITVSDSISKYLAQLYGVDPPVVIRNCQRYKPLTDKNVKIQELLGLSSNRKVILYFGRITFNRGLESLLESAAHIDKQAIIVLIGNGEERYIDKLKESIASNKLQDKFVILPPVDSSEADIYVSSADIGIIPTPNICLSYYFGASNKIFHYMAGGLPTLVSDHPEKRAIVVGNDLGEVFNPDDPLDIAEKINLLLGDNSLMKKYSENSLKASKIYNWENEEKKLLKLYERITG